MVSIVSHATAVCAAALVAMLPETSRADTTSARAHALPSFGLQAWVTPLDPADTLAAPDKLTLPPLRPPLDSGVAGRWAVGTLRSLELEFSPSVTRSEAARRVPLLSNVNLPTLVPPLLRYQAEETDVTLSISPGSPCTGACLKLAGSF